LDQPNGFTTIVSFSNNLHVSAFFHDAAQSGTYNAVVIGQ
jgi:hypothetical protein